jgi:hypothetical protein
MWKPAAIDYLTIISSRVFNKKANHQEKDYNIKYFIKLKGLTIGQAP